MPNYVTIDQYNKDIDRITEALTKAATAMESTAKILENHENILHEINNQVSANSILSIDLIEAILNILIDKNLLTLDEKNTIISRAVAEWEKSLGDTEEESNTEDEIDD